MDDYMDISGVSEITDLATLNDIPVLRDGNTPEEIFNHICDEIRKVCWQIKSTTRQNSTVNATATNMEKTVIMPEITSILNHNAAVVRKLTNNIKDSKVLHYPQFRGETTMSISVMMDEETTSCAKAVELLDRLRNDNDQYLKVLLEADQISTEMENTEVDPDDSDTELIAICNKAKKELKECQKDMEFIIDTLCKDKEISASLFQLLGALIEKSHSKRKEEWYEITDMKMLPYIMILCVAGAIQMNPQNINLVKLVL